MAAVVYNVAKEKFANGTLDWDTSDIRCLLIEGTVGAAATNPDSATLTAALTGSTEASGTGYVRKNITGRTVLKDDTNNRATLKAASTGVTWTGANWGNADGMIVYLHVDGTNGNDIPISFHDGGFSPSIVTNGGDLTINWAGAGTDEVIYLT